MAINRRLQITHRISSNRISQFADISATAFILCSIFVSFPSVVVYLAIFGAVLVLLCVKNFRAVMVGMCVGGMPFLSLVKSATGLSITQSIIGMITVEVIMLTFYKRFIRIPGGNKNRFFKYFIWIVAVYLFILANFIVSPKTNYNIYYIQFFIVYVMFSCLSGMLVVQLSLRLKDIFLPVLLFFVCIFPMFKFTLLNIPVEIAMSAIGLRGYEGFGCISLGRLAGSLVVLVFCVLWENRSASNRKVLFIQGTVGLIAALPVLWYSQTRQAMIASFLIVVLGTLFLLLRGRKLTARQRVFSLLILVMLVWSSYTFLSWSEAHLLQSRVHEGLQSSARSYLWQDAWEGISENPIIGNGYAEYYSRYGIWPHNFVLEVWYDYGFAGLVLFCGLIIMLFMRLYRERTDDSLWLLLGVYWIIVAQASADIPRNSIVFIFVTIAWLFPSKTNKVKENRRFCHSGFDTSNEWLVRPVR